MELQTYLQPKLHVANKFATPIKCKTEAENHKST